MESICDIRDLYRTLHTFEKEFSDKYGITLNEGMLLCCMKDDKSKSANEICDFLALSPSRGSRIITSAEDKNLIKREMGIEDKRKMIFTLTEEGLGKIDNMKICSTDFEKFTNELRNIIVK